MDCCFLLCQLHLYNLGTFRAWTASRKQIIRNFITSCIVEHSLRILDVPYDSHLHKKKLMLAAVQWHDCCEIFHEADSPSSSHRANHHVMCTIFEIDVMYTRNVSILDSHNILEQWLHHSLQTWELRHLNHPHRAGVLVHLNMFVILMVSDHCQAQQQIFHVRRFED